jgi:protein-export membrane protein SecD/preprotein translocase SecF subunit
MYEKVGWKIVLIIIIVGAAFFFMFPPFSGIVPGWMERGLFGVWPQEKGKLVLGEDLKGGLTMVLSVTDAKRRDEVIEVLNKRVNSSGLKEVYISALGEKQIQVRAPAESPGLRDLLMSTGTLEFRAEAPLEEYEVYDKRLKAAEAEGREPPSPQPGFMVVNVPGRNRRSYLLLDEKVKFTARDFADFYPATEDNRPAVGFTLSASAGPRFAELTRKLYEDNKARLAVFTNGEFESAPSVNSLITHRGVISFGRGPTTKIEEIYKKQKELLIALQSGALQTPITFESEIKTGPAIGEDSLRRGIISMLLGTFIVLLFMLVYYLAAGLIANVALVLNLVLVLGALCGFQATFTLPGFAGLILTIGMAVDANVLIFERIREEKTAGKALTGAVKAGYNRAFGTILDSNITTLVIGIVLWWQGTGPIRGFAITLSVGILASLFTSLFVGKVIFTICVRAKAFKEVKMQRWIRRPSIPFMKISRVPLTLSLILAIGGIGLLGYRGTSLLGIDFLGGAQYQINLSRPLSIGEIRGALAEILPEGAVPEVQSVEPRLGTRLNIPGGSSYEYIIRFPQQLLNKIARREGIPRESDPSKVVERVDDLIRSKFNKDFPPEGLEISLEESEFNQIKFCLTPLTEDTTLEQSDAETVLKSYYDSEGEQVDFEEKETDDGKKVLVVTINTKYRAKIEFEKETDGKKALVVTINTKYRAGELKGILDKIRSGLDTALGADKYEFTNTTDFNADTAPTVVLHAVFEVPQGLNPSQEAEFMKAVPGVVTRTIKEKTARETKNVKHEGYTAKVKRIGFEPKTAEPARNPAGELTDAAPTRRGVDVLHTEGGKKYVRYRIVVECNQAFEKARQTLNTVLTESLPEEEVKLPDGTRAAIIPSQGGITQAIAITGSVAKELRWKGFTAFIFAMIGIILYVWFRFRLFALLDSLPFFSLKFELPVVAALLTIVGYSINDSIVVFDRIRENMGIHREERFFVDNIDNSINQTLTRTIWTSLTTFLVVLCLAVLGGEMIRGFAVTMCVGVLVGTYSSVFIASPVLVWFHRREINAAPATHKFNRK